MVTNKNINDLLINFNPSIIRFTGEKFPTELWKNNSIKAKSKKISS